MLLKQLLHSGHDAMTRLIVFRVQKYLDFTGLDDFQFQKSRDWVFFSLDNSGLNMAKTLADQPRSIIYSNY